MMDRQCSMSWTVERAHVQCDTHHCRALHQSASTHRPNNKDKKDNNNAVFAVVRCAREDTNDLTDGTSVLTAMSCPHLIRSPQAIRTSSTELISHQHCVLYTVTWPRFASLAREGTFATPAPESPASSRTQRRLLKHLYRTRMHDHRLVSFTLSGHHVSDTNTSWQGTVHVSAVRPATKPDPGGLNQCLPPHSQTWLSFGLAPLWCAVHLSHHSILLFFNGSFPSSR